MKFDKLFRKIARDRWVETKFTSETAREAGVKSGISRQPAVEKEANERPVSRDVGRYFGESDVLPHDGSGATNLRPSDEANERLASPDVSRYHGESDANVAPHAVLATPERASAGDLGKEFGISGSTIRRVRPIKEHGTPEQIQ